MPKMDGIELSKEIFKINPDQIIIVISAYSESQYLMDLINIGVEKFLLKPFSYKEIISILYDVIVKKTQVTNQVDIGNGFIWDKDNETLTKDSSNIKLTIKELELLKLFIKNHSRVSLTQEIFNHVWSDDSSVATQDALKALLSRLRKKLDGVKIESIYNLGYKLIF